MSQNTGLPISDNTKFIFWSKFVICKPLLKLGKHFWEMISIVYSFLSDRKKKKEEMAIVVYLVILWFWRANNVL